MEYAAGGELFERIGKAGRFSEDEVLNSTHWLFSSLVLAIFIVYWLWLLLQARFFFQQLISGVSYCHAMVFELFCFSEKEIIEKFLFPLSTTNSNDTVYLTFPYSLNEANMPPGLEVGEYFVGWKPGSSFEDLWFWILQGTNCFHSWSSCSYYCALLLELGISMMR